METQESICLWLILVPTVRPNEIDRYFTLRYHKLWDAKVHEITGGLTILPPTKGYWKNPEGKLFFERMIPVQIAATKTQMRKISDLTAKHYKQEAIMFFKISDEVHIIHYNEVGKAV